MKCKKILNSNWTNQNLSYFDFSARTEFNKWMLILSEIYSPFEMTSVKKFSLKTKPNLLYGIGMLPF